MEMVEVRKKLIEGLGLIDQVRELQRRLSVIAGEVGRENGNKAYSISGLLVEIKLVGNNRWNFGIKSEVVEL